MKTLTAQQAQQCLEEILHAVDKVLTLDEQAAVHMRLSSTRKPQNELATRTKIARVLAQAARETEEWR